MAVIPSGMGWSADENWMKSSTGILGTTNIPHTLDKFLPHSSSMPSGTEIVLGGVYCYDNGNPRYFWTTFIGSGAAAEPVIVKNSVGDDWVLYGYNTYQYTISNGTIRMVNESGGLIESKSTGSSSTGGYAVSGTTYYRHYLCQFGSAHTMTSGKIQVFNSVSDADAYFKGAQKASYKLNLGYAVASMIKWRSAGTTYNISAILISSDPEFTVLSEDGTSESSNYYTRSVVYSGIRFTMGMITTRDAESGTATGTQVPYRDLSEYVFRSPDELFAYIARLASLQVTETIDPYGAFPHTIEDGGTPNPDPQDDDIDVDPLPVTSFSSAGFCRIYNPDLSDLQDLADYMWTDQNFLTTVINHLKQLIENPIDAVISLSIVPVIPDRESTKSAVSVMFINTGVSMRRVTNQFKRVDCGTVFVEEKYGSVLDYNPYTKVQLYLPFIGTVPLNTDEVMNKTLSVIYHVDVVTGVCCAEISADSKLLYQFSGHCSVSQPLNSADFSSYLNAAMAAAKLAVGAATGGAGAAAAAGSALDQISPPSTTSPTSMPSDSLLSSGTSLVPAGYYGSGGGVKAPQSEDNYSSEAPNIWEVLRHPGTINTAAATLGGKLDVQHSGGFSGNSGFLAKRRPYLIINRPQLANPDQYGHFNGYPSMIYTDLGSCVGYTQVQSVFLSGFDALPSELSEISSVLKAGVVF